MFFFFALAGNLGIRKELFNGANVNQTFGSVNQTILHDACRSGHIDVVEELLSHPKIDPNIQGRSGYTPLNIACGRGHVRVVKALLRHRLTKPNLKNKNGEAPFHNVR